MKRYLLAVAALSSLLLLASCGQSGDDADLSQLDIPIYSEQPEIGVDSKAVITVDDLDFKDSDGDGELDDYEDWRLAPRERAAALIPLMSNVQKVGLLVHNSPGNVSATGVAGLNPDGSITEESERGKTTAYNIAKQHVRFGVARLSNSGNEPGEVAWYFNEVQKLCEQQELGIPFVISLDPMHGFDGTANTSTLFTPFPMPEGLGAINDPETTRAFGEILNEEYRAVGVRMQLGPMADVATEPRWQRVQNTLGESFDIVANNIGPLVEGMQDGRRVGPTSVAAVIKHFPGAGPDEDGMDSHSQWGKYNIYPGDMLEKHIAVFQPAFDAGVLGMMPCYSIFKDQFEEQVGAAYSEEILNRAAEMGFEGLIVSDWGVVTAYGGMASWGVKDLSNTEKIGEFLKAGSHQDGGASDPQPFLDALDEGLITEAQIDAAAQKALEVMFSLGIFENPYVDVGMAERIVGSRENLAVGVDAMVRSTVLLKNDDSLLPLDKETALSVYFSGRADDSFQVAEQYLDGAAINLVQADYDAIDTGALPEDDAATEEVNEYEKALEELKSEKRIAAMAGADVAVIRIRARDGIYFGIDAGVPLSFLGKAVTPAGEVSEQDVTVDGGPGAFGGWVDGVRSEWNKVQEALAAKKQNPDLKVIIDMYAVRPGIVEPFIDELDGFFVNFGATDEAFCQLLFGDASPSGKLPMEIPSSDEEVAAQFEDVPNDTPNPTFEFGAGLSY